MDSPGLFEVLVIDDSSTDESRAIVASLRSRHPSMVFGGFPGGKGFAIERESCQRAGGIPVFHQFKEGRFVCHLSADWDLGISMRDTRPGPDAAATVRDLAREEAREAWGFAVKDVLKSGGVSTRCGRRCA